MNLDWRTLLVGGVGVLPGIITLVEVLHPRKAGDPPQGPTKTGAVIQLAQNVLTVAAAGAIPNADAQNIGAIAELVQEEVVAMKRAGKLGGIPQPQIPLEEHTPTLVAPTAIKPDAPSDPTKGVLASVPTSPAAPASTIVTGSSPLTTNPTPSGINLSNVVPKV